MSPRDGDSEEDTHGIVRDLSDVVERDVFAAVVERARPAAVRPEALRGDVYRLRVECRRGSRCACTELPGCGERARGGAQRHEFGAVARL